MTNIKAVVIADSVSAISGKRITTYELEYPRFIHGEFMTHRMISRNAASSRAIPVKAMLDNIRNNPAVPSHWGKNQAGMQASEECNETVTLWYGDGDNKVIADGLTREGAWNWALANALYAANQFSEAGYHKQIVNRLTEPFQMIKVVATATEWDNFFWLRKHKDAQPEIRILAEKMWEARDASVPEVLRSGEWHTPYVQHWHHRDGTLLYAVESGEYKIDNGEEVPVWNYITKEDALKVSASMCAQVSYRKADDTLEKALLVYSRLVDSEPVHASPFEHQATPMSTYNSHREECYTEGVTGWNIKLGFMSGNFVEWVQHRQLIPNNTCWDFNEAEYKETKE